MAITRAPFIRTPEEITAEWLGSALGRPGLELLGSERIGTGQMSQSHRVSFRAPDSPPAGPETVVVKLASDDPTSRATGLSMALYFREVAFYSQLATRIGDPLPGCHLAEYDPAEGWFTLVLEDILGLAGADGMPGRSGGQRPLPGGVRGEAG